MERDEKKGHVGPTQIKRRRRKNKNKKNERDNRRKFYFYFFIFSLTSLFDILKSDCQNSSGQEAKCSTRRGLCVGTKNTGFRRVFN